MLRRIEMQDLLRKIGRWYARRNVESYIKLIRELNIKGIILDPFAGGGSIPFAASYTKNPAIANDLNPVAVIILEATLKYPYKNFNLAYKFSKAFADFKTKLQSRIKGLYKQPIYFYEYELHCPVCSHVSFLKDIRARSSFVCPSCNTEFPRTLYSPYIRLSPPIEEEDFKLFDGLYFPDRIKKYYATMDELFTPKQKIVMKHMIELLQDYDEEDKIYLSIICDHVVRTNNKLNLGETKRNYDSISSFWSVFSFVDRDPIPMLEYKSRHIHEVLLYLPFLLRQPVEVLNKSAQELDVKADYIITDPPYFNFVYYNDISVPRYAFLSKVFPERNLKLDFEKELVAPPRKSLYDRYYSELKNTIKNFAKLTDNLIIEWGGTKLEQFTPLLEALYGASFHVKDIRIQTKEDNSRMRKLQNNTYATHSLALICSKHDGLSMDGVCDMVNSLLQNIVVRKT